MSEEIVRERKIPVSRACKIVSLPRSQFYYHSTKDAQEVIEALQDLAFQHPTYGFRKLFAYIPQVWQNLEPQKGIPGLQTAEAKQEAERKKKTTGTGKAAFATANSH